VMGAKLFQFGSLGSIIAGKCQIVKPDPKIEEVTFREWCCI
jgi:hypothetical protein